MDPCHEHPPTQAHLLGIELWIRDIDKSNAPMPIEFAKQTYFPHAQRTVAIVKHLNL
jgi:hypothetical protein